ncbi:MAG: Oxidoreductase domain protein [Candidatus Amesbacteria bacterium GW2011_GWB1_47_19]|nr:MAG: Oxidoreductase domain protein [Candidatus Amesbacteria bacterium GW2011_GWA1_44_24]KKU31703.1 MAG: Oxidoreductase domain protein [Candidatus Amesbacteria bacterium GW2011_GWC1_46_24]KKU67616.1 MAG: Oxidoreductase domain protein [Candidatus Amesbacteria bacterium GW2011_GWB1_47_19]OGD06466.1 MAG: hypothetical protein A2379_02390 [Candidatus Amesbacteria bacterium RIFOXYB1_FULL_47_13]HBC72870.1 LmbZ [Candidatus Amesbacteria bacterium]
MKIGIIGAGIIGTKRAEVIKLLGRDTVFRVADTDISKAESLSNRLNNCKYSDNWQDVVSDLHINAVIVSTTHNRLAEISKSALISGKHVLCEKPLGLNVKEITNCVNEARKRGLIYKTGYNHRFHPAIFKAYKIFVKGKIGNIMYIKSTYGIGGRPGYEKEWRMNPMLSGGGELIDQGSHLIDLVLWFMGTFSSIKAELTTSYWPVRVEDNAFLLLRGENGIAELHASWTEWKNRFIFEVYGTEAYLKVNGLGGSYGTETLVLGLRTPGMAPKERVWKFSEPDPSWKREWINFKNAISGKEKLLGTGSDGLETMKIIENIYRQVERTENVKRV